MHCINDLNLAGVFDFTNNNNNNNNGERDEKEQTRGDETTEPMNLDDDEQLMIGAASPLTAASSSPRDPAVDDRRSTPPHDCQDVDVDGGSFRALGGHSSDVADRASERSSAASDLSLIHI